MKEKKNDRRNKSIQKNLCAVNSSEYIIVNNKESCAEANKGGLLKGGARKRMQLSPQRLERPMKRGLLRATFLCDVVSSFRIIGDTGAVHVVKDKGRKYKEKELRK